MPSWKNFKKATYVGGLYEAQDVLVETDDVDLIDLNPADGFRLREKWQRRLLWRDKTKMLALMNPGLHSVQLGREYELFVAVCQNWWDLLYLNAIKGWEKLCKTSVCWIDEIWAAWVPRYRNWLHILNRFDHVVLNLQGSVEAVEKALQRRCHWVPYGIDAVRFSPYPNPPKRVIDIYSIGRRWDGVHRALLKKATGNRLFYIYDTVNVSDADLYDPWQHRELYSSIAKRSKFFLVAPAKMDFTLDTSGQNEVGTRYFEGAAAGAVLLGEKANCDSFSRLFDWPDSVIEIKRDGSDINEVLSSLLNQPERLRNIGERNCIESLLRHDWAYRWEAILSIAGLTPKPAMAAREKYLVRLADLARTHKSE